MLASYPASILNHILRPSGIPFDSFKDGNALAAPAGRGKAEAMARKRNKRNKRNK